MNGPAVIVRGGQLVEEDLAGRIYRRDGISFVERPLIDPMMCWSYAGLNCLGAGIEVPEESVEVVSMMFREAAEKLGSEAGRAAYIEEIAKGADAEVPENSASR